MTRVAALCPDHDHHTAIKPSGRDHASLAIVAPVSFEIEVTAGEQFCGVDRKIQSSLLEGTVALARIERDDHSYLCSYINR